MRQVSDGVQTELPRYFTNYLWNFYDSLRAQDTRFPYSVVFVIVKQGQHCDVYCNQFKPAEHLTLELIDNALVLPDEIIIQQQADRQLMRLADELTQL
ncbi:DUF960 family protein [Loigolactobacillus binensis]|uniref:DUF960 family protein n=1 Tax=Loigolactobacillus binensis TaxID=2559922 RepID=A0ABW3EF31_9LACO|nr:DUF960 family protein [Loigolactobacillus binensis]